MLPVKSNRGRHICLVPKELAARSVRGYPGQHPQTLQVLTLEGHIGGYRFVANFPARYLGQSTHQCTPFFIDFGLVLGQSVKKPTSVRVQGLSGRLMVCFFLA